MKKSIIENDTIRNRISHIQMNCGCTIKIYQLIITTNLKRTTKK